MVQYFSVKVSISDRQKKKMVDSIHSKSPFSLKLGAQQYHGSDELWLTARQKKKVEKHKSAYKGIILKFSHRQLTYMAKKGGFLLPLLGSVLGSLIPGLLSTGVKSVEKAVSGNGIKRKGRAKYHMHEDSDLMVHGQEDHEGGFLGPLLAGLASGALSSLFSGAVNKGVAKKAGVEPLGSGLWDPAIMSIARDSLKRSGKPIPSFMQGDFLPDNVGHGLTGVGGHGLTGVGGHGLVQLGRGMKKKQFKPKMSQGDGLFQMGVRGHRGSSIKSQAFESSPSSLRVI